MTWVHPLLIALGKMRETSYAVALANTVYILTIAVAAPQIGLSAVILAFGIQSLSVIGIKIFIAYNEIKFGQSKS